MPFFILDPSPSRARAWKPAFPMVLFLFLDLSPKSRAWDPAVTMMAVSVSRPVTEVAA